jgi:RimJ/RimL family protein N-acetyltransferase
MGLDPNTGAARATVIWMSEVRLEPFGSEQLPVVQPWFEDVDTQKWLGGPGWPSLILDLAGSPLGEFRGAVETGRHAWLAWHGGTPVGFIDCGTTDRWTTWEGGPNGRGVMATVPRPTANISYVVNPAVRQRGYGTAIIRELLIHPELAHIKLFAAGIDSGNVASIRCARAAGFTPLSSEPDWEGVVYYVTNRPE